MMFTDYGKRLAASEDVPEAHPLGGATAHMHATQYDADKVIRLTGTDSSGRKFTREAHSVYGAYMTARAMWGINRAWHVREDGTRRLVFKR